MRAKKNRYSQMIEDIFFKRYHEGASAVVFDRAEIIEPAPLLRKSTTGWSQRKSYLSKN